MSNSSHVLVDERRAPRSAPGGLDGVVVAETALSEVDGARGRLIVRGYAIEVLAGSVGFEALLGLLWDGALPAAPQRSALQDALGLARCFAHQQLAGLTAALALADAMDSLRACVATLAAAASEREQALRVTAAIPVFAAAWQRHQQGLAPLEPDPALAHAADSLRLLGLGSDPAAAAALDAYWVTVADHGLNASTFAARVVASTESDTISAVTAALGALKGRLHGGAPGPVLDMLDAIGSAQNARTYLERELAAGRRIMGMGHRIYRVRDPRAEVLERATRGLRGGAAEARLSLARSVEAHATELLRKRYPERTLCANVEFFTAVLLEAIGVPRALFTAVFAGGRVAGYCAHIAEQRQSGRLLRPASRYIGPQPDCGSPPR